MVHTVIGGEPHKLDRPLGIEVVTASKTLTLEDNGIMHHIGTDALVMSLPPVGELTAPAGTYFGFRNVGADGNNIITISPAAADAIFGTIANAAADSVASGVDDKDFVNTKVTANKGDLVWLVSDGVTGYYVEYGVGIWASEA